MRNAYWVGERLATYDKLSQQVGDDASGVFRCKVKWGCFWQERPEDCLTLYRDLMSSPAFVYVHTDFWTRELDRSPIGRLESRSQSLHPAIVGRFSPRTGGLYQFALAA